MILYIKKNDNAIEFQPIPTWEEVEQKQFYFVILPDTIDPTKAVSEHTIDWDKKIFTLYSKEYKIQKVIPYNWVKYNSHIKERYIIPADITLYYPKSTLVIVNRDTRKKIEIPHTDAKVKWNNKKKIYETTLSFTKPGRVIIHLKYIVAPALTFELIKPVSNQIDSIF